MISSVLILFFLIGAVSAVEVNNVSSTEDSNLASDNVNSLSVENKLEVSSEDSISETNIVNSHDDVLDSCLDNDALSSSYEDDNGKVQASNNDVAIDETAGSDVLSVSNDDTLSAKSTTPSTITVSDTHYAKSATYFKVTLTDKDGGIGNQKVSLKVNGKTYTGITDANGVASVKTAALAVGTYSVTVAYAGNSNYSASSLSKKVKVLSSVSGSDITRYYGPVSQYSVTFWKNYDALANTKVSFTVNGVTYKMTTDKSGVASLPVNLKPGKYVIYTSNPYSGEKLSNNYISKKDSTSLTHGSTSTYIAPNKKCSFTVTLKSKHNVLISGKKIVFKYNNKKVTAKTNSNGKATITIPALSKGTYSISYSYDGDNYYSGSSESGKLYVKSSTTKLTSSKLKMTYNDGSKFAVTLKDNNKVLANKDVKFTLNGKTFTEKTNSKGVAYLTVGNLKPATYTVKYQYLTSGAYNYCHGSNKIIVSKQTASLSAGDLVMNYKDGSAYEVTVKDKSGNPLKDVKVKFTINGVSYTHKTNSNGVAKQDIGLNFGYYSVKTVISNTYYKSSTISKHITIKGTKMVGEDIYVAPGKSASYSVKLLDSKNNPVKNTNITFTVDGNKYVGTTNTNGVAKVNLGVLSNGTHKVKYSQGSYTDGSKIYVVTTVTIKQLIASSKSVENYIEKNHKVPSTVKIGSLTYSTAEYLYLASKAIINLKSGKTGSITVKDVDDPTNPSSAYKKGNLKNYLAVAKNVVSAVDSSGKMPNSVGSSLGTLGYKTIADAFSRIVSFYGYHHRMPAHVKIKSITSTSKSPGVNTKNTISDLTAYLAASKNCQVNSSKIKQLVNKLTKGLKSDKAKANAIYKYVRDTVSYTFYYNTRHGATGTLKAKSGNCVDHAHLLVAMYRTAGLPARYAHGTCKFSSGGTYGHVWAQVLIGNTWKASDATSSRNSLGKVVSWNTKSYKFYGFSSSISF